MVGLRSTRVTSSTRVILDSAATLVLRPFAVIGAMLSDLNGAVGFEDLGIQIRILPFICPGISARQISQGMPSRVSTPTRSAFFHCRAGTTGITRLMGSILV